MMQAKFFRTLGILGGFMAVGIVLVSFVPIFLAQVFNMALPAWVLTKESYLVNLATTLFMGYGAACTVSECHLGHTRIKESDNVLPE